MSKEIKMEWKQQSGKYENRENLILGNFVVGSAHYNSLRSKDDPRAYKASCLLPGMERLNSMQFMTLEEAKQAAEDRVSHWLKHAGLSE